MNKQGLIPSECSRFDVVSAYAAYGDWWNVGGLTARDRARGPDRTYRSISFQLYLMRYRPAREYFTRDDYCAVDIYLGLVRRWEGEEAYQRECLEWMPELD